MAITISVTLISGLTAPATPVNIILSTLKLEINHIILAVNEKNILAQKAYRNSGFFVVKKDLEGKKGKLIIMEKSRN